MSLYIGIKNMNKYEHIINKLEPIKIYGYRELLGLICKGQSSTASYILMDLLASGIIDQVGHDKYRLNQKR